MTVGFAMPRRLSRDENFDPIEEEPAAPMIGAAEQIHEIGKRSLQLLIDRNECLTNLRFSFDTTNQEKLYHKNIAINFSFWRCHRTAAKKYWEQFQKLEKQRAALVDEIIDLEKSLTNQKIKKKNLLFQDFWAGQNGNIYESLQKYNLAHMPCCTIM